MCIVEGCERPTLAKGLCALHYTRQRRNGDPAIARQPGKKKRHAALDAVAREFFPEWSERTRATYVEAWARFLGIAKVCRDNDSGEARFENALKAATRKNGTLNVKRLRDDSMDQALIVLAQLQR